MAWWQAPAILERLDEKTTIVREDLIEGGSKIRFLPYLVQGAREIVYGGPFCGGAAYALSVWGKKQGVKVTLFYAKRGELHQRQKAAFRNGAQLYQVPFGYMTNVQAKARAYAAQAGALFLPLGFDLPGAADPFVAHMRRVRDQLNEGDGWMDGWVDEVWCATGSGMLARCLGLAFPKSRIRAVVVGLRSRNGSQRFSKNVELIEAPYRFEQSTRATAPFPSCGNYDRKAWEQMAAARAADPGKRRLFWNVLG